MGARDSREEPSAAPPRQLLRGVAVRRAARVLWLFILASLWAVTHSLGPPSPLTHRAHWVRAVPAIAAPLGVPAERGLSPRSPAPPQAAPARGFVPGSVPGAPRWPWEGLGSPLPRQEPRLPLSLLSWESPGRGVGTLTAADGDVPQALPAASLVPVFLVLILFKPRLDLKPSWCRPAGALALFRMRQEAGATSSAPSGSAGTESCVPGAGVPMPVLQRPQLSPAVPSCCTGWPQGLGPCHRVGWGQPRAHQPSLDRLRRVRGPGVRRPAPGRTLGACPAPRRLGRAAPGGPVGGRLRVCLEAGAWGPCQGSGLFEVPRSACSRPVRGGDKGTQGGWRLPPRSSGGDHRAGGSARETPPSAPHLPSCPRRLGTSGPIPQGQTAAARPTCKERSPRGRTLGSVCEALPQHSLQRAS